MGECPPSRVHQGFDFGEPLPERPVVRRLEVPLSVLIEQARQRAPRPADNAVVVVSPDIDQPDGQERPAPRPRRLWRKRR